MRVLYDHQAFTFQNYGGISRYFYKLLEYGRKFSEFEFDDADLNALFSTKCSPHMSASLHERWQKLKLEKKNKEKLKKQTWAKIKNGWFGWNNDVEDLFQQADGLFGLIDHLFRWAVGEELGYWIIIQKSLKKEKN